MCANGGQDCIGAKSVGRLLKELHLTLFPQGLIVSERARSRNRNSSLRKQLPKICGNFARQIPDNHDEKNKPMKTTTKTTYLFFAVFMLACFAPSPQARAVCQQGCDLTNFNTFLGDDALISNTSGTDNMAIGKAALFSNTTGRFNSATGAFALDSNTTGSANTANGTFALLDNTTGNGNTAIGEGALESNFTGSYNTANGFLALTFNSFGSFNTAVGAEALNVNTLGSENTAVGDGALLSNSIGSDNTAEGFSALEHITTGSFNIALGSTAGLNLTTESSNIDIGHKGVAGESNTIRIGRAGSQTATFIAGISGVAVTGSTVIINSNGKLGVAASSARFKDEIKPMAKASEAVLALKPVMFRYKHDLDPAGVPQFGLVAEEVQKVNPDLVVRDEQGKPYTVRYDAVNAMLLNEFLKEHKAFVEEHRTVEELKKQVATLTAGLQKVSAQLEVSKTVPRAVVTNQ
jgi:hypothetical protein